ncbi:MAG TPA: methylmalonyl-CoA mutase family protein [Dermatophilaceae bacterium]|jgi:methylmalonyl-CoA mutase N-terminal domain/subunit|uniref:Methylmalonyl-CoA mutase n=1 Tax=Candidatus Phosphoribacter hodrii TaxID=2953743 RepID=A0A934X5J6_9MICO|nr:methylmalonyl-CoA mutase [Candidatus Phosphoribacter hodrii]HOA03081.1 methylmalonyl-CoA mutase family protein [Dermatophilaceae bacterium]MBL0005300.1 methylmalonyl-CoA mutase [Candidatus Phosphoribacter hodrii]HOA58576.1 methylmalonyl-CoA mutase family protein [Dermatophilaceae bacterium]HOF37545.1 methylmalonyl-CoA mutase family protein [Dermatophilaceae bacterium]
MEQTSGADRWQARYDKATARGQVRDADFTTLSGMPVEPVYGPGLHGIPEPQTEAERERMERIGWPGEFPFTRGLYPTGYRGRTWTIRQFAGFGNAVQTNERYKMILERGGGGLSVAFDMPTLMGRDSDDPHSLGEVGHCGVAIDSAADMEVLFGGIPLGDVTTSMTISGPAVPVFCMYLVAAERQGVDIGVLNGTLQTDIFKEYIAQKEWLFEPGPHLRLIGDLMEFCTERIPDYKPLSVSGYHIREAGSTAAQELAFTLADGFGYVELGLSRGLDVETFAPGLSFFFDAHVDFFEEIAKFRAARRIWARWMRDVYGAKTDKAQWLRFHTQTAGVSLTAQQPYNNVVRTAVEALAAVLGGTNSLHTNALDETLALPTEQAAEIALRTQQVIMHETGVTNVADPLGGSWYVEALTDRMEAEAEAIFTKIKDLGVLGRRPGPSGQIEHEIGPITSGLLRGIEEGWFMSEIADAAFQYQISLEKGDKKVVGVNLLTESVSHDLEILRVSHQVEVDQVADLTARRSRRDEAAVQAGLAAMLAAARGGVNMIPAMLDAVRAEATLGEICDVLRDEWGIYREPAQF